MYKCCVWEKDLNIAFLSIQRTKSNRWSLVRLRWCNCSEFLKKDMRTAAATFVCQTCILSDPTQAFRSFLPVKKETN